MIVIDGRQSAMEIGTFANLEEILVKVVETEVVEDHVVTDVFVNQEAFTEIYPHHAEDIDVDEISSVEIRTVSMNALAKDVTQELFVVVKIMQNGAKGVAGYLRQGDTAEGLEVLQDLLDVTRNFLGTIAVLQERFPVSDRTVFEEITTSLDRLLAEMGDVMSDQDWLLLADLLEYEFYPACEEWDQIISGVADEIAAISVE